MNHTVVIIYTVFIPDATGHVIQWCRWDAGFTIADLSCLIKLDDIQLKHFLNSSGLAAPKMG
jgi:hypothetical protein